MIQELLRTFKNDQLTEKKMIEAAFTELASSLYGYMIMLKEAGRNPEFMFYDSLRKTIFECRSDFTNDNPVLDRITHVYYEIRTAVVFLRANKPNEGTILQSPENDACGLMHIIKDYEERNKAVEM